MRCTGLLSLFVLAFALLTSSFAPAFAQTALPTKDSKEEQEKLQKALEGKALKLLDATVVDAQTLKLVEIRLSFSLLQLICSGRVMKSAPARSFRMQSTPSPWP